MSGIELNANSAEALEVIIGIVIPLVVGLASLAVTALLGRTAWAQVVKLAREARGYVDDPNSFLVVTIDGVGELLLHRKLDEARISQILTAVVDHIAQSEPPKEVNIGDTTPTA